MMAIPVTNIPVLTGEVAERFIEQCEYNAQHLRGSEYRGELSIYFAIRPKYINFAKQ